MSIKTNAWLLREILEVNTEKKKENVFQKPAPPYLNIFDSDVSAIKVQF